MGVVKKNKTKTDDGGALKNKESVVKKNVQSKKAKNGGKIKKKRTVSCLQCIKSHDDGGAEGKYRVAAPELMQDTFMSDSEDEGGEVECPIQQQQQYRYMNSEAGTLHRAKPLEDSVTDGHLWPSNNDRKVATMDRQPLDIGFLVSFVVDARGGAMKAKRRGGVRIIVPPAACAAPTRVTCRAATRRAPAAAPPPLMEGEALASRLLELQPQGAKFLAPVIIEVPIYTASCREREIVILRSDTGDTWQDHYLHHNDNPMIQEALQRERHEHGPTGETLGENGERVCRIVTCDFPHYLACVSRVRQEVHIIGPEGGTVSSAHTPQVQALFPPQALTKRIRVGLQAHSAPPELSRRVLPRHVTVAPVITVEPRRRKFHRTITLTSPLPDLDGKPDKSSQSLRLLCSIMGGQARAVWEDVTGSTPLTLSSDCASFTTTVSARFWLMNCQNVSEASKLATDLYREMLLVPFDIRIVVLGKRLDAVEGRLLVLPITDRYAYDTLLRQEHYTEVAHSTAVRLLDGKEVFLEFSGNLVPVTKSGSQPSLAFESFKDNRVEFSVRVKHHEEPAAGRIYFMNEPKVAKGEQSQTPACVLDVVLPDQIAPRAGKSQLDHLNLDQSGFDALHDELSFHYGDHNNTGPASLTHLNGHDKIITNGNVKYTDPVIDTIDEGPKPKLNGDTIHNDSNKKATFDSDEDKTPHNTLEKTDKGKKKDGFFGGIAGKVKNVFGHSDDKEDKDDSKESSPKPKKDKTPPADTKDKSKSPEPKEKSKSPEPKQKSSHKSSPKIINEDLLDKVEDMFKDLKTKPRRHDDDLETAVHSTKVVVDEKTPAELQKQQDELYVQYANMQPVETPIRVPKKDPFQFPFDCCDGKDKHKHTHDETSNLVDRIENVKFTESERLAELADQIHDDVKDGSDKLGKERDNIKQKAVEITEDLIAESEKLAGELKNKGHDLKSGAQNKHDEIEKAATDRLDELLQATHKAALDANNAEKDFHQRLTDEVDDLKTAAKDTAEDLDFFAKEKAAQVKDSVESKTDSLKRKAQKAQNSVEESAKDTLHEVEETVESAKDKAKDAKSKAKKKGKEGKNFLSGLAHNIFGSPKKIEKEMEAKLAEGKEAANNLVEKAESKKDQIKEDIAKKEKELKQDAENLAKSAQAKKEELEKAALDKAEEAKKAAQDKAGEAKKAAQDKKSEIEKAAQDKANEIENAIHSTKENLEHAVQEKTDEAKSALDKTKEGLIEAGHVFQDKASEAKLAAQNKADEAKHALQDAKATVEDEAKYLLDQAAAKKDEIKEGISQKEEQLKQGAEQLSQSAQVKKDAVVDGIAQKHEEIKEGAEKLAQSAQTKTDEISQAVHDTTHDAIIAVHDKKNELEHGIQRTTEEIGTAVSNKKDEVQKAASSELDRITKEAEHTTEQIKKSAEETLNAAADKKDEIQTNVNKKVDDLKQSGQETLDDIQSSASQKASDIRDSSREAFAHAQDSALGAFDKFENVAKDRVSDAKDTWSDLQTSSRDTYADFRDDIHGLENSAQDTLHSFQSSAGDTFDSLEDSTREFVGGVQHTANNAEATSKELFGDVKGSFEGFQVSADNKLEDVGGAVGQGVNEVEERLGAVSEGVRQGARGAEEALFEEADHFTSNLNDLGNSVFGSSGKGLLKDSTTQLLESEKAQASPTPQKKGSGIPKLKKKNKK